MSEAVGTPGRLELPPMTELISQDVNAGDGPVYVGWATDSTYPPDGDLHAFVTTDERAACVCQECGAVCRTPPEVRSGGLHGGHFMPTADPGGIHVARPAAEICCEACGDQERSHGGPSSWPQRDHTPKERYSELGRVQRAVVQILAEKNQYVPPPQTAGDMTWTGRTDLTRRVATEYYDDATANTITSSVSRAVQSLIDDPPVLVGAYRGWQAYYGDATPAPATNRHEGLYSQGETVGGRVFWDPDDTPTLEKVRLRWGRDAAAAGVYFAARDCGYTLQVDPRGEADE